MLKSHFLCFTAALQEAHIPNWAPAGKVGGGSRAPWEKAACLCNSTHYNRCIKNRDCNTQKRTQPVPNLLLQCSRRNLSCLLTTARLLAWLQWKSCNKKVTTGYCGTICSIKSTTILALTFTWICMVEYGRVKTKNTKLFFCCFAVLTSVDNTCDVFSRAAGRRGGDPARSAGAAGDGLHPRWQVQERSNREPQRQSVAGLGRTHPQGAQVAPQHGQRRRLHLHVGHHRWATLTGWPALAHEPPVQCGWLTATRPPSTAGLPKAAEVSHGKVWGMSLLMSVTGVKPWDVLYTSLPLYHSAGFLCFTSTIERGTHTQKKMWILLFVKLACLHYDCVGSLWLFPASIHSPNTCMWAEFGTLNSRLNQKFRPVILCRKKSNRPS